MTEPENAQASEAEKQAKPRRRTTKKAAAAPAAVEAAAPEAAEPIAEAAAKPRRRRTTKKDADAEAAPAAEAAASEAAEPAAKPLRRTRKSAEAEAAPAPEAVASAAEPAAKPRRRARKSADADADRIAAALEQPTLTEEQAAALLAEGRARMAAEAADAQAAPAAAEAATESDAAPKAGRTRSARRRSTHAQTGEAITSDKPAADTEAASAKAEAAPEAADQGSSQHKSEGRDQQNNRNQQRNNRRDRNKRNREVTPSVTPEELAEMKVGDLRERAASIGFDTGDMKKAELVPALYKAICEAEGFREVTGVLDVLADGYGFLRTQGYLSSETDCYVGTNIIKRNGLRKGDMIVGQTRPTRENEKYAAVQKIISVNDVPLEQLGQRVRFADLTPIYPEERLWMEHGKNTVTARVVDLVAPIGKGQRGLIVSPPKAGKTTILKDIAAAISANNPEVHLMCLLVDERPEEVTDMQRSIHGEVISSTFDMPADNHITVAEMCIERAKRLVECGKDVVILLDSITRLARAYNLAQPASGRVLSGGVDSTALYPPKRFFGAARNIENGGSLTILATGLVETGSKMDEVIFEEFKGTGNMELRLDRALADRRIFPAIDPVSSSTRKEELLMDPQLCPLIWAVRRILANMNNTERAMDMLIKSIKNTENNEEFLIKMARKAQQQSANASVEI